MKFDVVTIGSAVVDTFSTVDADIIKIETRNTKEELLAFELGSKVLMNNIKQATGGGGTNTAVTFARMGLNTAFLGKIGDDANGAYIEKCLKAENIKFIGSIATNSPSGFSLVLNSIKNNRTILNYKGVNDTLAKAEVPDFECEWIYSSSMVGESFATIQHLAETKNCKFAFNPSSYQTKQGIRKLMPMIESIDALIMNKTEALELLGMPGSSRRGIPEIIRALAEFSPKYIMITNGPNGTFVADGENLYHASPADNLSVVETTGAGDAMASAFIAGLAMGKDTLQALLMGMNNCEAVISGRGAKEHIMTREEVLVAVANDMRRVDVWPL